MSPYQKKHSATHLSWSSIIPYLLPPSITFYGILPVQCMCLSVFLHNPSPSFLLYTSWPGTLQFIFHTPNHCFLFTTHAHTIATCFALVPPLCHLILVSTWNCILWLKTTHPSDHSHQLPAEVPPHFLFLQARSHFHATYYFAHNCCTISLSLSMMYLYW